MYSEIKKKGGMSVTNLHDKQTAGTMKSSIRTSQPTGRPVSHPSGGQGGGKKGSY